MNAAGFPVVGVGASAGGIDAFHGLLEHMPADCGMAFVMILHLPADRKSMLTEILSRWTSMPVVEAVHGTRLRPNHVYVPPPHVIVTLAGDTLLVEAPSESGDRVFRPIDTFFDALGSALRERAIGIVLSGTGSDGALGLKAIKECGGLTIAQGSDGGAPQYGEMPAGAISTGSVDVIAGVDEIPGHLMRLKGAALRRIEHTADTSDAARLEICTILREQLGHDFSGYRSQTFLRRVDRRMQVRDCTTLDEYIGVLRGDPQEVTLLFRDLLIRVTSFFRDAETFEILARKVIPRLFDGKMADGTVRVWVTGCATGEEAYSLAILLREFMDSLTAVPRVQLFATDIDEAAITTARLGRYPQTLLEGLPEARLRRFFTQSHGSYSVNREIRDLCTFSEHNLTRDPPFSRMNLVSCRNLLIYMNPGLQARVIPVFHYSLVPDGILLLGGSESVAQHSEFFETIDKAARIYKRCPGRSPELNLSWSRPHLHGRHLSLENPMNDSHTSPPDASGAPPHLTGHPAPKAPHPARFEHLLGSLPVDGDTIKQVQNALGNTCEELQSLHEEHQTALEELRSANEELHSLNEEMQSSNEELETSKEELQSLNEELHTVNIRLTEKLDELDATNSDLRNLFDSTQIATAFLDRHLIIRSFTPAIATLYNLIPSDEGRPLTDIVSQLEYTTLRQDVAFVLSSLEPLERRVARIDRTTHYILRILPYRKPDSTVTGVLVTFIDVSSIVQAEEALVAADVRKDVFLATLSHELRNPLAPIRMAAQLLQSPSLPEAQARHARAIIGRQVAHMGSLLDDLLDVSRITRSAFLLKKTYVEVRELMSDAVEAVQSRLDEKQHTLRVEFPATPMTVEVDAVRVTQVITNLLANAVKYTASGGTVFLGTRLDPQHLVIFVRDNGVGLTADSMGRVFDMFTRIDSGLEQSEGGLGIGLALAKGLVELHGGEVRVHSAGVGKGSEFTICLPRSVIIEREISGESAPTTGTAVPKRILVADDNRDNAETMSMLLQMSGHVVHVAHNGVEAFELAKSVRPDIGIFDIGMPDMNGYELAARIRHEAWSDGMKLIAVTGWGQEEDRNRALAAGFNHHLTKPVDVGHLESLFGS